MPASPAGRLCRPHAAGDGGCSTSAASRGRGPLLHAAALPAPLPLRPRQAAALPVIIGLATAQWLGVFVTYMILSGEDLPLLGQIAALLGVYVAIIVVTGLIGIALKWLVLGRTKPGVYPLWGVYYFRWWFAARVAGLVHIKWLQGTPVMRFYWRLLGAKVGRDVIISDYEAGAIDLIEIGDGTSFGSKTTFANGEAIGDKLVIGRITIGKDVSAGASVVLGHGW
jgi:non-ribosomal peptide synthetase-like protein